MHFGNSTERWPRRSKGRRRRVPRAPGVAPQSAAIHLRILRALPQSFPRSATEFCARAAQPIEKSREFVSPAGAKFARISALRVPLVGVLPSSSSSYSSSYSYSYSYSCSSSTSQTQSRFHIHRTQPTILPDPWCISRRHSSSPSTEKTEQGCHLLSLDGKINVKVFAPSPSTGHL